MHTTSNFIFKKHLQFVALSILLIAAPIVVSAQKRSATKDRVYKEYTVNNKNEILNISNKYGNVDVETWEQNKVTVEVEIEAWGRNQKQADELSSQITIEDKRANNEINFRTTVNSKSVSMNSNSGFKINYRVKMPKVNPLRLVNKYGSTYVGDLENDVEIDVAYGTLRTGKLTGKKIELEVSYASSVDIEEVGDAYLDLAYPGNVEIDKAGRIEIDAKYGKLRIGEAISVQGSSAYLSVTVDKLEEELDIRNKFAASEIGLLGSHFKLVNVNATHGSFSMGIDENTPPFNFVIKTSFGSFKGDSNKIEIIKEKSSYTSADYEGNYKGGGTAKVYVETSHGSVRFR